MPAAETQMRCCRTTSATNTQIATNFTTASLAELDREGIAARVTHAAQLALDAQQLVVLGHSIRARERSRFDLGGRGGYGDIGDRAVLRLPGAMRHDRCI